MADPVSAAPAAPNARNVVGMTQVLDGHRRDRNPIRGFHRARRVRPDERDPTAAGPFDGTFCGILGGMKSATSRRHARNLHVPLSEATHLLLRAEAERSKQPATALAREAIDQWLAERQRAAIHDAIRTYAQAAGGTADDLDPRLETAAVQHLLEVDRRVRRARRK